MAWRSTHTKEGVAFESGVTTRTLGNTSLNTFQRELLKAVGYDFTSGRQMLGEEIKINANGTIVLSPTRAKQAGFEPGDELQIIHNPTNNSFTLKKGSK